MERNEDREIADPSYRRGFALLALLDPYPKGLVRASLEKAVWVAYAGDDATWNRDLTWLSNQKLITRSEEELPGRTVEVWTLTDLGMLVAEGSEIVAGVKIARPKKG